MDAEQHRRSRPLTEEARDEVLRKRESGHSFRKIVKWLENERYETPRGKEKWHASQVSAIIKGAQIDKAILAQKRMLAIGERALRLPDLEQRLTVSIEALEALCTRLERDPKGIHGDMRDRAAARSSLGLDAGDQVKAKAQEARSVAVKAAARVREAKEHAAVARNQIQEDRGLRVVDAESAAVKAKAWVRKAEESAEAAAYEDHRAQAQAHDAESEFRAAELYLERAIEEIGALSFKSGRWAGEQTGSGMAMEATGEIKQVASMAQVAAERAEIAALKMGLTSEKAGLAARRACTSKDNVRLAATTSEFAQDRISMATKMEKIARDYLDIVQAKVDTVAIQAILASDWADIAHEQVQFVAALEVNDQVITDLVAISHQKINQLTETMLESLRGILKNVQEDHEHITVLNKSIGNEDAM